jgi:glycoprotein endo-alpha-1,2-mannosidase
LKRKVSAAALMCMLLVSLALLVTGGKHYSSEQTENKNKIGAYYYIWWGMDINPHWIKDDIKGNPFLGHYNSSDPTAADQHILFAKQHGIDFFTVSWIGKGDWLNWDFSVIDQNLRSGLLQASHLKDFNFCLFYETKLVLDTANQLNKNFTEIFINDMVCASQQYFNNPSYLRVNGKPVLFIYNMPYLYENLSTSQAQTLLDLLRQTLSSRNVNVYLVGDMGNQYCAPYLYSMDAVTSYRFSDVTKGWQQILEDADHYYSIWRSDMDSKGIAFVPNAYPGFNNTLNEGVTPPWVTLPRNVTAFKDLLEIALSYTDSNLGIAMITSWNEWMEGTMVEPSMEDGELFLHAIYDTVNKPISTSTPTPTPTPSWLPIVSFILGAIVASGVVIFYFLKVRKKS